MRNTRFPHAYVLNVMSDDHPGIVAAVCGAVNALGGNIDACSQTVLSGYFTLIMIVSFSEITDVTELQQAVRERGGSSDFQVEARAFEPPEPPRGSDEAERFVVTAFGKDQPGIVLRFTGYLAGKDINIIDMYGDLSSDEFVLITQVQVPKRWDIRTLQGDLQDMGDELGFTVRFQHEDVFVATNQLRLTRRERTSI